MLEDDVLRYKESSARVISRIREDPKQYIISLFLNQYTNTCIKTLSAKQRS